MDSRGQIDMERSGITVEQARACGVYTVPDASAVYAEFAAVPSLVLPYYDPRTGELMTFQRDGETLPMCRVRYLEAPPQTLAFVQRKVQRYGQPKGSGVHPYITMGAGVNWWSVFNDPAAAVCITEGEKKAAKLCLEGIPTIGLGGVYNFLQGGELLPLLADFNWRKKPVYICFDSDAAQNPNIQAAEGRLAEELSLRRGASVHLVRIPAKGQDKVGVDDYIVANGRSAFIDLLQAALPMRKIDAAVLALNESIAWINREEKVYDLEGEYFMRKDSLTNGSKYSAMRIQVPTVKGTDVKTVSIPDMWLRHQHAQRYEDVRFDPSTTEPTISVGGKTYLNLWKGWEPVPGRVDLFTALNDYVFSELPQDLRDFPLKLMAYKFQNPHRKIPLAIIMVGDQGSGKSLWAKLISAAAGRYGKVADSKDFSSDYNGFLEQALVLVIDEAKAEHINRQRAVLRKWISEKTFKMNEKYRKSEEKDNFATVIISANERGVGSFEADDRRMFVVECPNTHPRGAQFYTPIYDWMDEDPFHGQKILHYLLSYDLKGWTPPVKAPLTTEKFMAHQESLTPLQQLAEVMRTGADMNIITMWIMEAERSLNVLMQQNDPKRANAARATQEALGRIQIRPYYTPTELSMLFPMVAEQFYNDKADTPAGLLSRQLRECGIKYLINKDDPRGFMRQGRFQQYLIIAPSEDWPRQITQAEFDRQMAGFPEYWQVKARSS